MADERGIAQRGMYTVTISLFYGLFVPTHIRKTGCCTLPEAKTTDLRGISIFLQLRNNKSTA